MIVRLSARVTLAAATEPISSLAASNFPPSIARRIAGELKFRSLQHASYSELRDSPFELTSWSRRPKRQKRTGGRASLFSHTCTSPRSPTPAPEQVNNQSPLFIKCCGCGFSNLHPPPPRFYTKGGSLEALNVLVAAPLVSGRRHFLSDCLCLRPACEPVYLTARRPRQLSAYQSVSVSACMRR